MTAKHFVIADNEIVIYPSMFTRYIFYLLFFFFIACLSVGTYILAESANSNSLSPGSYLLFLNGLFFLVLSLFAYGRMRRRIIIDRNQRFVQRKSVFGVRLLAGFSELGLVRKSYHIAQGSAHVNYYYAIPFKDPSATKEIILTNSYTKSNHPKLHGFEAQVLPVLNQWLSDS